MRFGNHTLSILSRVDYSNKTGVNEQAHDPDSTVQSCNLAIVK